MIVLPWTRQPVGRVRVNWNNPITRGLCFLWTASENRDLVSSLAPTTDNTSVTAASSPLFGTARARRCVSGQNNIEWNRELILTSNSVGTGDFSMFAFANPASGSIGHMFVQKNDAGGSPFAQAGLLSNSASNASSSAGSFAFFTFNSGSGSSGVAISSTVDGNFHLFGGVREGSNHTAWVDGTSSSSSLTAVDISDGLRRVAIGSRGNGTTEAMDGDVPWAAAWNRALTPQEVHSIRLRPWQLFAPQMLFSRAPATSATATLDAAIQTARSATATLNGVIQTSGSSTATLNGVIQQALNATVTLNAAIQAAMSASGTLDAVITTGAATAHTVTLNAAIQEAKSLTATLNAVIQTSGSASASLNAVIVQANSSTATLDATIQAAVTAFALLDAYIFDTDAPVVETTTVQAAGRGRRRRYIMPDDSVVIATPSEAEQLVKLFVKPVPPKKPPKKAVKALKKIELVEIEEVSSDTVPTERITVKKKAVWERSDLYDQAIKLLAEREILRRRREEEMILLAA